MSDFFTGRILYQEEEGKVVFEVMEINGKKPEDRIFGYGHFKPESELLEFITGQLKKKNS